VLTFDDVAQAVKRATFQLESVHGSAFSSLHCYRSSGGQGPSWRTAGAYLDISDENRLVLEALYLNRIETCVLRVYQEQPPKVMFARKFSLGVETCADLMQSAFEEFGRCLPPQLPAQTRVPASLGMSVAQAMLPVPPPVDVSAIQGWSPDNLTSPTRFL
jgi:hypothetical protein